MTETKERYNQCQNINCGATFVSHETFVRWVAKPALVEFAPPHPEKGQQTVMCFDNP
ncbi:ogr/Delta-like zinc finger family protein [Xenorhabdus sp. PB62.4]|uniref:ogr/Delta-like zinc finger family protein n=1 Tax=Xenorhabdus sp. PB62.4 TaxID=1851573 RepID=UPI00165718CD